MKSILSGIAVFWEWFFAASLSRSNPGFWTCQSSESTSGCRPIAFIGENIEYLATSHQKLGNLVLKTCDFLRFLLPGKSPWHVKYIEIPCSKDRGVSCNHGVQRSRPSGGQDQMPYRFIGWLSRTARAQDHAAYSQHIMQVPPASLSSNQA